MLLRSEINPIKAVSTAPPMMLITRKEEAVFVSVPSPFKEFAKIVGNMTDMKKLVIVSAKTPACEPAAKATQTSNTFAMA
jgi:hypothetical protein